MKYLVVVLLMATMTACVSTYGSKDFSSEKLATLTPGTSTVDQARTLLGKPERDFRGNSEQVRSMLGSLLSTVLPEDFLDKDKEYILWTYEKRGSVDLILIDTDSEDRGILLFDANGVLIKTFDNK